MSQTIEIEKLKRVRLQHGEVLFIEYADILEKGNKLNNLMKVMHENFPKNRIVFIPKSFELDYKSVRTDIPSLTKKLERKESRMVHKDELSEVTKGLNEEI